MLSIRSRTSVDEGKRGQAPIPSFPSSPSAIRCSVHANTADNCACSSSRVVAACKYSRKRRSQGGKFSAHDLPNYISVDAKVVMDEDISETGNGPPRSSRFAPLDRIGESLAGLGKSLEITHHCVLHEARRPKKRFVVACVLGNSRDAFEHMGEIDLVSLRARLHVAFFTVQELPSTLVRASRGEARSA